MTRIATYSSRSQTVPRRSLARVNLITLAAAIFVFLGVFHAWAGEKISLTFAYKPRTTTERIESFKITVRGAWVHSLPKIPKGWSVQINDLGHAIEITGYASHGAGMEYSPFFKDFIIFEIIDTPPQLKEPFGVESEITVDLGPEAERSETIVLGKNQLLLRRLRPASPKEENVR